MAKVQLERLQQAHDAAARELEFASSAAATAEQERASAEEELEGKNRLLRALDNPDDPIRDAMLDSTEFNPDALREEARQLWKTLSSANRTEKETSARLSVARIAEKEAYSALQAHRHREAVRAALAMEIKLHDALNQERAIRAEVIDREGGMFSCSLPFFARYGYDPAITQARLSEARAAGYIDANETGFKL